MTEIKHSSMVTSEALSVISKLKKPDSGFESIYMTFFKLEDKVSETVLDQFSQHAKYLKELSIYGERDDLPEVDKPNIADLATKILEE